MNLKNLIKNLNKYSVKTFNDRLLNITYISNLLNDYDGNIKDLKPYIHFNPKKKYTRNLIVSDNNSYAVVLMCWNKKSYSSIHDHKCYGCWVRPVYGAIEEITYKAFDNQLVQLNKKISTREVLFINNFIGLHKLGNPNIYNPAIALHIYMPPITQCQLWLDEKDPTDKKKVKCEYHSINGKIANY